ncbi:glycosyltransferase [Synechococcus sp. CBW1107]|uniref:glycosyltransferase n=1 Tax=Synechococcus sp. CBW1107 TaxID=2789857 RepID=UPI0018CD6C69|nr:glycosyltransferase [Synechococcus sp. CBW1107]QPN56297.1 glycosyltransferase [Synechococcus sp. CBW1107]
MQGLLIHQAFPAQFLPIAQALLDAGHEVHAIGADGSAPLPSGCRFHPYDAPMAERLPPGLNDPGLESALIRGERVADLARDLKQDGLEPRVILFHSAWGEGLYLRELWPEALLIAYPELFGSEALLGSADPDSPPISDGRRRLLVRNNLMALSALAAADAALTPTLFQRDSFPAPWRGRFQVIHEGIDTASLRPAAPRGLRLSADQVLAADVPVLTFVSRNLEPLRGFGRLMRALPPLLRHHPDLQVVLVGGHGHSYSPPSPHPGGYLGALLEQLGERIDRRRCHAVGLLRRDQLTALLQRSTVHAYLSYPYVLSWSLLEAMACGAVVVASDTAPVRDVIRHGHNGLLVPLEDPAAIAARIDTVLRDPASHRPLGQRARATVLERYRRDHCMAAFSHWIDALLLLRSSR